MAIKLPFPCILIFKLSYLKSKFARIWRVAVQVFIANHEVPVFVDVKEVRRQLEGVIWNWITGALE